jgi:tetratricopeptide (TPR) repeat protein
LSAPLALALAVALLPQAGVSRDRGGMAEAERLAAEAVRLAPQDPAAALQKARRALAMTLEFVPTEFVTAGRKGEVVEDEFQAARDGYRRHRAGLYEAVGTALARRGDALAASRYQRRAFLLDPTPDRGLALARSLNDLGRGREALDTVQRAIAGLAGLKPGAAEVIARAADVAGLPSAQAEIDRGRLAATLGKAVQLREGPLELPPGVRLSTSPVVRLDEAAITVLYASEATCRNCSADLEGLARQVPKDVRVIAVPPGDDQDQALRQVLALYKRTWPLLMGRDLAARLQLKPRSLLLVARGGWTLAVLQAPFGPELASALAALQRVDVQESVPRPSWNRRPVDRGPLPPPPGLLPEGLAPGEDEPFPPEFTAAVEAYRAGRANEALAAVDALEAKGDGWLLPPEARLDRALCLARAGQRDAARRILLRTGDSRFEDETDRLLETVAEGKR